MSAIFTYPDNYVDDTMKMFYGYMERASLLYKLELEGRIDQYVSSSSHLLMEAAKEPFFERMKKAFIKTKDALIEFIKNAFKAITNAVKSIVNRPSIKDIDNDGAKTKEIEIVDRKKEIDEIIGDKDKLFKISFNPKAKVADIKEFMKKHKIKLSDKQKQVILTFAATAAVAAVQGLYNGYKTGFNNAMASMNADQEMLDELTDPEMCQATLNACMEMNRELTNSISKMQDDINRIANATGVPPVTT